MAEKAKLYIEKKKKPIEVMFNPRDYNITQKIKYTDKKKGQPQFCSFEYESFTLSLFYDTYEEGSDVRETYTDEITKLTQPNVEGKKTKRPPECIFCWGSFAVKGVVEKVRQKFTMFLATGIPVRAEITLTFIPTKMAKDVNELINEACRKHYTVKSGDRLDLIAHRTLKDPLQWRKIAQINNITNPFLFPTIDDVGKTIIIPD